MSMKENEELTDRLTVDEEGLLTSDSDSGEKRGKKWILKAFHRWKPEDWV